MKSLEVKATKTAKKLVAAEIEKKHLEAERPRQLAQLFEAEDISDDKGVRRQKELLASIDSRLAAVGEKIKHYREKTLAACIDIVEAEMAGWRNGERESHLKEVENAELAAGEKLGQAVAVLEMLGAEHSTFVSQIRRGLSSIDPRAKPMAVPNVAAGFTRGLSAGAGGYNIDRQRANALDAALKRPDFKEHRANKIMAKLWREQRNAAGFDSRPQ